MKVSPILFSTPMVLAILASEKFMTRRIVKGLPNNASDDLVQIMVSGHHGEYGHVNCPYGKPDDILWVREEHKISKYGNWWICEFKDGTVIRRYYKSLSLYTLKRLNKRKTLGKWQRARFLPKDLYRISLKIESVKVERLENISEADAIAEGIERFVKENEPDLYKHYESMVYKGGQILATGNPKHSFKSLWISINGLESWTSNPWVWVVKFKVLTTGGHGDIPKDILMQLDGKGVSND